MNKQHNKEPHGMTLIIHVVPKTNIDALVLHVKEVASQIIAAHAEHISITGSIEIMDEYQAPLNPDTNTVMDDTGRLVFKE